jgi:hypothetical protein
MITTKTEYSALAKAVQQAVVSTGNPIKLSRTIENIAIACDYKSANGLLADLPIDVFEKGLWVNLPKVLNERHDIELTELLLDNPILETYKLEAIEAVNKSLKASGAKADDIFKLVTQLSNSSSEEYVVEYDKPMSEQAPDDLLAKKNKTKNPKPSDLDKVMKLLHDHTVFEGRLLLRNVPEYVAMFIKDHKDRLLNDYNVIVYGESVFKNEYAELTSEVSANINGLNHNTLHIFTGNLSVPSRLETVTSFVELPKALKKRIATVEEQASSPDAMNVIAQFKKAIRGRAGERIIMTSVPNDVADTISWRKDELNGYQLVTFASLESLREACQARADNQGTELFVLLEEAVSPSVDELAHYGRVVQVYNKDAIRDAVSA